MNRFTVKVIDTVVGSVGNKDVIASLFSVVDTTNNHVVGQYIKREPAFVLARRFNKEAETRKVESE